MNNEKTDRDFQFSKLLNYFLQGLLVIAPIAITIYAVYSVVSFIDNQVPIFTAKDETGKVYVRNYGLGFLIVIVAIIFIIRLLSTLRRVADRAERVAQSAEAVGDMIKNVAGPATIMRLARTVFEAVSSHKQAKDKE